MMPTVLNASIFRASFVALVVCWLLTFAAAAATTVAAASQKTVNDGVYTAAQADRGEGIFKEQCASCHAPADFTADDFLAKWTGQPLHALFDTVSGTMPMDNPGTLKPQQYADVLARLFELSKLPAGQQELPVPRDQLDLITIGR